MAPSAADDGELPAKVIPRAASSARPSSRVTTAILSPTYEWASLDVATFVLQRDHRKTDLRDDWPSRSRIIPIDADVRIVITATM